LRQFFGPGIGNIPVRGPSAGIRGESRFAQQFADAAFGPAPLQPNVSA
jgi:hypothetical protein